MSKIARKKMDFKIFCINDYELDNTVKIFCEWNDLEFEHEYELSKNEQVLNFLVFW